MLIEINDLYTKAFWKQKIKLIYTPYVSCAYDVIHGKGDLYRQYLTDQLKRYGNVWGYIYNEKDIALRVGKFKRLAKSLQRGYDQNKEHWGEIDGIPYGGLSAYKDLVLIDGHHRIALLYVLGEKVVKLKIIDKTSTD